MSQANACALKGATFENAVTGISATGQGNSPRRLKGRIASEVSGQEMKEWLRGRRLGTRTRTRITFPWWAKMLKFATQKHYVAFSPLNDLTDVDRKELCGGGADTKEPKYFDASRGGAPAQRRDGASQAWLTWRGRFGPVLRLAHGGAQTLGVRDKSA